MITVEEMSALVEKYIYEKRNVRVSIQLRYHPFLLQSDLDKLHYCYNVAHSYFNI
jgi:hypothetical protein